MKWSGSRSATRLTRARLADHAAIAAANVGPNQAEPLAPDRHWAPDLPPPAPGPTVRYTRRLSGEES